MAKTEANNGGASPVLNILTQYIKDFSFESPNAPHALRPREKAPPFKISVDVNATSMGDDTYDVLLTMNVKAGEENDIMFNVELVYGGVFKAQNFPEEHIRLILFIECPRLLFPFARHLIADATRNGGFPPLMIDPIDFGLIYERRLAEENAKAQTQGKAGNHRQ